MSELENAPLIEVIFEIKWGQTIQKGNELQIELSNEEIALMPGKMQMLVHDLGFDFVEVIKDQPPIPHLVKYRYRKQPGGYPLFQLGDGIFAVNQIDVGDYEYNWESYIKTVEDGVKTLEKCYPFPMRNLPLIDIQLRYRDAIIAEENECILAFISNKLNVGNIALPTKLIENENIFTDCATASLTLQVGCNKPNGQLICRINQGMSDGQKAFIIDFIVISKANVFAEITSDSLVKWCTDAHDHHRSIFESIISDKLMETFK